jgi:translation elongation factor EF-G
MELVGETQAIKSTVPLSTMFGYATHMRYSTQGHANCSMQFKRYEPCPTKWDFGRDEPDARAVVPKSPRPRGGQFGADLEAELNFWHRNSRFVSSW